MMAPPQRWEPATCRLTCQGQDPREANWPPEALLEFTPLPQSEDETAVREDAFHCNKDFTNKVQKRSKFCIITVKAQVS